MKWTWTMIASLSVTGCMAASQQQETLTDVVRAYNESVRWQRFDAAAGRLPPKQRAARVEEWDELSKDVRITEFEIVRIDPGKQEAHAHVKLSWYSESEQIVHETHALETWERKGTAWMMVDEERLRGDKMPGLPEHVEHKHKDADHKHDAKPGAGSAAGSAAGGAGSDAGSAGDAAAAASDDAPLARDTR